MVIVHKYINADVTFHERTCYCAWQAKIGIGLHEALCFHEWKIYSCKLLGTRIYYANENVTPMSTRGMLVLGKVDSKPSRFCPEGLHEVLVGAT